MRKGTKRNAGEVVGKGKSKEEETNTQEQTQLVGESVEKNNNKEEAPEKNEKGVVKGRAKRAKIVKPDTQTEYFPDKRNLEDLWQEFFPVGTEWDQIDMVYQYKWNFPNLEDAFEESEELHGKKVYLLVVQNHNWFFSRANQKSHVYLLWLLLSPFPPFDKIGINSVQRETEEILPMKQMKMDWVPYIPLEKRKWWTNLSRERSCPQIKKMNLWYLSRRKVKEGKKRNREAREARKKAIQEMSEDAKAAFQSMKFCKFYPVTSPDAPDISQSPFINRYYGKALKVF